MTSEEFNASLLEENANARATDLTKREYFAGLAMQALLTDSPMYVPTAIHLAVMAADQMLELLEE